MTEKREFVPSTETGVQPEAESRVEKREAIYETLERRIGFVRDMWQGIESLDSPNVDDSAELIEREIGFLRDFVQMYEKSFPGTDAKSKRQDALTKEIEAYSLKENELAEAEKWNEYAEIQEKIEPMVNERHVLDTDIDVVFYDKLQKGMEAAIQKRHLIRGVQQHLSKDAPPQDYIDYIPDKDKAILTGKILKATPMRFSICLTVDVKQLPNCSTSAFGAYTPGTIWAYEKKSRDAEFARFLFAALLDKKDTLSVSRSEEVMKHEDFHAFFDGFESGSSVSYGRERVERSVKRYVDLKQLNVPDFILQNDLSILKNTIRRLIDSTQEEVLAEVASLPHMEAVISRTSHAQLEEAWKLMQSLKGIDSDVDGVLGQYTRDSVVVSFQDRLRNLYGFVEEHAPEKLKDLDAALVLLPLSKLRHVERLAERWKDQSKEGK